MEIAWDIEQKEISDSFTPPHPPLMYLPEPSSPICPRAVDQQWMEENCVSSLHLQVNTRVTGVIVHNAVVHFIHTTLHTYTHTVCSVTWQGVPRQLSHIGSPFLDSGLPIPSNTGSTPPFSPPIWGRSEGEALSCVCQGEPLNIHFVCEHVPWLSSCTRSCRQVGKESSEDLYTHTHTHGNRYGTIQ